VFADIDGILKQKGKTLDLSLSLNMPGNDPKFQGYVPATEEEIGRLETAARNKLDTIRDKILNRETFREIDMDATLHLPALLLTCLPMISALTGLIGVKEEFYADRTCTGCGTCARVCLSGKIAMAGKRPAWMEKVRCCNCYSCLNYCPVQSVQMKSSRLMKFHTEKNGRYSHPYAMAKEIAAQKGS